MIVRKLGEADIDQIREIAMLRPRVSGTEPPKDIDVFIGGLKDPNSRSEFYGVFDGEQLISWIAFRFGELHGEQVWAILGIYSRVTENFFTFNRPDIKLLIRKAFSTAEDNGVYIYVYSIAKRLEKVYETRWKKNDWITPGRYELFTIAVIPANVPASENWQLRLMGGVKPDDVVIKKRILREKFRK